MFFRLPTTKWRPCQTFAKLNGKHLLMANIFELHKYQIFVYWICMIWGKSDLPIVNSVCEKVWFTINGMLKILFFNFSLFHFFKFQMTIVKILMEKPSSIIIDFQGSYEVLPRHKYSWSTYFWQWNDSPFFPRKCILFLYFF